MQKKKKHLQICSLCGSYMSLQGSVSNSAGGRHWQDDTFHRSFGGLEVRKFICEKCGHREVFQVDDLVDIEEDP